MVEAGFGQAAVTSAVSAVTDGLVHGALNAVAAGVAGLNRDHLLRGAGSSLGFGEMAGRRVSWRRFPQVHRARAGQEPQSAAEKCTTIAFSPRWAHGVQDACGHLMVLAS